MASSNIIFGNYIANTRDIVTVQARPIIIYEANSSITQTISNSPNPAWDNTYGWSSKFTVILDHNIKLLTIKVKLYVNTTATVKANWKLAVERKWSNKKKLQVIEDMANPNQKDVYRISIIIEWMTTPADAHYTITANQPSATSGGRAGLGGTTSMTGWGVRDTIDVPHEFGHMLGNKDEYYTIDGVVYGNGRHG